MLLTLGCFSGVEQALESDSKRDGTAGTSKWLGLWASSLRSIVRDAPLTDEAISAVADDLGRLRQARASDPRKTSESRAAEFLSPLWAVFYVVRAIRMGRARGSNGPTDPLVSQLLKRTWALCDNAEWSQFGGTVFRNALAVELLLAAEETILGFGNDAHRKRVEYAEAIRDAELDQYYYFTDALRWARAVVIDGQSLRLESDRVVRGTEAADWVQTRMPAAYVIEGYQAEHVRHFVRWERAGYLAPWDRPAQ